MFKRLLKMTIPKEYRNKLTWSDYLQSNISVICYIDKNNWYFLEHTTGLVKKAGTTIDYFKWE